MMNASKDFILNFLKDCGDVGADGHQIFAAHKRQKLMPVNMTALLNELIEDGLIRDETDDSGNTLFFIEPDALPSLKSGTFSVPTMADLYEPAELATTQTEVVQIPESLLPSSPMVAMSMAELPDDMLPTDAIGPMVRSVERTIADVGIMLPAFSLASTVETVRDSAQKTFIEFLRTGAALLRVRLTMSRAEFDAWVKDEGLPIGHRNIYNAMNAVRAIDASPELRGIAKGMTSIKKFQVVQRVLSLPGGLEEFRKDGKVLGLVPDEVEQLSKRKLEALEAEHKALQEKNAANEAALAQKTEELKNAHQKLAIIREPELAPGQVDKDYLEDTNRAVSSVAANVEMLRPTRRKDLEALDPATIHKVYAAGLYLHKHVNLLLREIETTWGTRLPELLLDENGEPRTPYARQDLRILTGEVLTDYEAAMEALRKDGQGTFQIVNRKDVPRR